MSTSERVIVSEAAVSEAAVTESDVNGEQHSVAEPVFEHDSLVEEVSIDGMCGVY